MLTHVYSKTNLFSMRSWPVIVVQSAVVRRSRQGNEGNSWKLLFNTQLAKILMCRNVCHSGFMTGEDGGLKCFRRMKPRAGENRQPH